MREIFEKIYLCSRTTFHTYVQMINKLLFYLIQTCFFYIFLIRQYVFNDVFTIFCLCARARDCLKYLRSLLIHARPHSSHTYGVCDEDFNVFILLNSICTFSMHIIYQKGFASHHNNTCLLKCCLTIAHKKNKIQMCFFFSKFNS